MVFWLVVQTNTLTQAEFVAIMLQTRLHKRVLQLRAALRVLLIMEVALLLLGIKTITQLMVGQADHPHPHRMLQVERAVHLPQMQQEDHRVRLAPTKITMASMKVLLRVRLQTVDQVDKVEQVVRHLLAMSLHLVGA
jgi:hypothetical protein